MARFPSREIRFTFRNWREETAERRVVPDSVWFGVAPHHPDPQWHLHAFDLDRDAFRDFPLDRIQAPEGMLALAPEPICIERLGPVDLARLPLPRAAEVGEWADIHYAWPEAVSFPREQATSALCGWMFSPSRSVGSGVLSVEPVSCQPCLLLVRTLARAFGATRSESTTP